MEKYSVLMSVYHREKCDYLRQSLASVFEQTIMPDEVIIVKDGPLTDQLDAVIDYFKNQYDSIKIIALPQNVGLGNALNEGLKHCSYDLVGRMDSDDICKADRFEKQLSVFSNQPQISVVGSWVDEFDGDIKNVLATKTLPQTPEELKSYSAYRNPLNHPSTMFRKKDVSNVGGYQHFYLFEDYYLWIRVLNKGYKLYNIQESLVYFRANPQMIARRGGWQYAVSEVKFFKELHKMRFIGTVSLIKNILIRFPIRILPNKIRIFVYNKILR